MSYKFKLPNQHGQAVEQTTESNAVIIIGANGSGKSRLGAWIEQQDMKTVHRIGAQRSLMFGDYIQIKSLQQAENQLLWGSESGNVGYKSGYRWHNNKFTTSLLSDYEAALSALLAKKNEDYDKFVNQCKIKKEQKQMHCDAPYTDIDKLLKIWDKVFPQRNIKFDDAKVTAIFNKTEAENQEYKGNEMSDGERVALYLLAQCLCVPSNETIIIDEPEIHLHRSIMNKLWIAIEKERHDCLFIYITHDTQFAAAHQHAEKIWVKSFNGTKWEWEIVSQSDLPEQCLLDILGNRKNVLFVEGEENSYDTQLYREIYKGYYVIPCGGCSKVISSTKAMRENNQLHHLQVYGLIDRDYRTQNEIDKLNEHNIFTLEVAEVENLFCVEEVLKVINEHLGYTELTRVDNIKSYIINDRFAQQIEGQIYNATVAEVKYKLSTYDIPKDNAEKAQETLGKLFETIKFDEIREQISEKYQDKLKSGDYCQILLVFNQKELTKSIGHYFGVANNDYCKLVIRLMKSNSANSIINAVIPYLPTEIPI